MSEFTLRSLWRVGATAVVVAAAVSWAWGARFAGSVLAGGAWNLASLWCLSRLLTGWLGRSASRRQIVGWLLVKFPLLYLLAFSLLRLPALSLLGFSVGFTVVLTVAIVWFAIRAQRMTLFRPHGR